MIPGRIITPQCGTLKVHTWSCLLVLCWASGRWWASYIDPPLCPSVSGCCPETFAPGSSTRTCLWRTGSVSQRVELETSFILLEGLQTHTYLLVWLPLQLVSCWDKFSSSSESFQRAEWPLCWAWEALRPSVAEHLLSPGTPGDLCSSAGVERKQSHRVCLSRAMSHLWKFE